MNILQRKLMLAGLKKMPAVSQFRICDMLRPYLRHYGLTLGPNEILFPEEYPYLQDLLRMAGSPGIYEKSIPYTAIVHIRETPAGADVMLRTGHVFRFSRDSPVWLIDNIYGYGEPLLLTVWLWRLTGNSILMWSKIKRLFTMRKTGQAED